MGRSKVVDLDREVLASTLEDKVHQNVVVLKVGGSCLVDSRSIDTILDKVTELRRKGIVPVLVVSALKGLTDSLLKVADSKPRNLELTDSIVSQGEQLSAKIIHSKLENIGIESEPISLDEPSFPIVTDDDHGNAEVLLDKTEERIKNRLLPLIHEDKIPIVPGFVGITEDGKITTMGRGASDTSAILLGRGLEVSEVILLKDVPGVLSGDPKIIDSPKEVSKMTVKEALELGKNGGDVLCPSALKYKSPNLKIRVVNYDNNDILEDGTEIVEEEREEFNIVMENNEKTLISIIGSKIKSKEIIQELEDLEAEFYQFSMNGNSISYLIDQENQDKFVRRLHDIVKRKNNLIAVSMIKNLKLLEISSSEEIEKSQLKSRVLKTLNESGISPVKINYKENTLNLLFEEKRTIKEAKKLLEGLF